MISVSCTSLCAFSTNRNEVSDIFLFNAKISKKKQLLARLEFFNSIAIELRDGVTMLHGAHVVFDHEVKSCPSIDSYIEMKETIIEILNFQNALVEFRLNKESQMTKLENRILF